MATTSRPSPRWWPFAIAVPVVIGVFVEARSHATGRSDPTLLLAMGLLAVVAVCAIWQARPSWSISAALALSMFGSNWQQLGLPRSVAPDRLVLGVALIALAARAPGARDRPPIRFRPLYAIMYFAGAYAIGSAIAAGTAVSHSGIFTLLDRMQILDWVVFVMAQAAFTTAHDRRVLLGTLIGMGVYLGLTGIFEIVGPHALVFPRYINNPTVGIHYGRARGPFVEAVVNGLALYACTMASLVALREWRTRLPRALAMLAIAVCIPSLVLTLQRSDWIGAGLAAALTMLVVRQLRRYVIPTMLAVAALIVVMFAAFPTVREHASTRLADVATVQGREGLNAASMAMIEARPLFGFGWGRFQDVLPDYVQTSNSYSNADLINNPVHDVYLSIATELGLVGDALWLIILFCGVGGAVVSRRVSRELRAWQIALGSLFVMWLVVGTSAPLAASFESLVIWLWAAVIVGAQYPPHGPRHRRRLAPLRHSGQRRSG